MTFKNCSRYLSFLLSLPTHFGESSREASHSGLTAKSLTVTVRMFTGIAVKVLPYECFELDHSHGKSKSFSTVTLLTITAVKRLILPLPR